MSRRRRFGGVLPRMPWRRRLDLVLPVVAAALTAAMLSLPLASADFTATTVNAGSTLDSDTLDAPTGVAATSGVSISLDWTTTVDPYATGYRVYRSSAAGGPYTQIAELPDPATVTYVDTPAEGTFYYRLRSYHLSWESADTAEVDGRKWRAFDCPSDPDLRACIRFDDDLGGTYADESANGNTVTHSGGAQVPGISGDAIAQQPGARYEVADSPSLDLAGAVTIEAWVRFDSLPSSGRSGVLDNDGQFSLIYIAGSGLRCDLLDNLFYDPVPVGVWFHVACSWDGTTHTMYIDGLPVGSGPSTGTIDTTNTEPMSLLDTSPLFDEPMNGTLDNLRIWSTGRTQAQICADAGITTC